MLDAPWSVESSEMVTERESAFPGSRLRADKILFDVSGVDIKGGPARVGVVCRLHDSKLLPQESVSKLGFERLPTAMDGDLASLEGSSITIEGVEKRVPLLADDMIGRGSELGRVQTDS